MIINLNRLNILLFSFLLLGSSMFQENTYFIKGSFVTLLLMLGILYRDKIYSLINNFSIQIFKPFFHYLVAYSIFLFLLYISINVNSAYNSFSEQVFKSVSLNMFLIIVSYIVAKNLNIKYLKVLMLIILSAFLFESLFVFFTHNPSLGVRHEGFGGILQLGQDTSFILCILISYFLYNIYTKKKVIYIFYPLLFIFLYALYATGSRSPILGLLIASIFIYCTLKERLNIKNIFKVFFTIFSLMSILYFTNNQVSMQINSVFNPINDVSNASKLVANIISLNMFIDNPFFGSGLGTFEVLKEVYMPSIITSTIMDEVGVPHNMFLGILGECGIFVFIIFLYIMIKPIYIYKALFLQIRSYKISYLFLGLMGFMIVYNIDSFFHNYYTQNFIWLVIGFSYGIFANKKIMGVNNEYSKNF